MNKAIVALVLVLALSAQPALAGKAGARHTSKAIEEPRSNRATVANAGHAECKKYFALIGSLVSVPCVR